MRARILLVLLLLILLFAAAEDEKRETVAFNVKSRKFHCLSCYHVKGCSNCVRITLAEAKERGGVACRVCGGSCN